MSRTMSVLRILFCAALLGMLAGVSLIAQEKGGTRGGRKIEPTATSEAAKAPEASILSGTLTTADPTFNRPAACGTPSGITTHYDTFSITVAKAGTLTASVDLGDGATINPRGNGLNGPNTFMVLYGPGAFNPASPGTNCIAVNDDKDASTTRSRISANVVTPGTYTLVFTSVAATPANGNTDDVLPWTYTIVTGGNAGPVIFGPTDFIVGDIGGGKIASYDSNLTFKGYLDVTAFQVAGIDAFTQNYVAALVRSTNNVKLYDNTGTVVRTVAGADGSSAELKVQRPDRYYITNSGPIKEVDSTGAVLRTFGTGAYGSSLLLLPGNKMWAGKGGNAVDVFDLTAAGPNVPLTTSINIANNTQTNANAMTYSATTNTVLMVDNTTGNVYERNVDATASFVRMYNTASVTGTGAPFKGNSGATRGPLGNVYVTVFNNTSPSAGRIAIFNGTTGAFISSTDVTPQGNQPGNIIWLGNATTAAGVTVSGRVMTPQGRGVKSTTVTLTAPDGSTQTVDTSNYGQFSFSDVLAGRSYTITVGSRRFSFPIQVVSVNDNVVGLEIVANP